MSKLVKIKKGDLKSPQLAFVVFTLAEVYYMAVYGKELAARKRKQWRSVPLRSTDDQGSPNRSELLQGLLL